MGRMNRGWSRFVGIGGDRLGGGGRGVVSYLWYVDCQCSVVAVLCVGCCGGGKPVV